jgi:hypothetical protein
MLILLRVVVSRFRQAGRHFAADLGISLNLIDLSSRRDEMSQMHRPLDLVQTKQ